MLDICEFALQQGKSFEADEVEAYAESSRTIRITIQNNSIDLARTDISEGVGVRIFKRKGLGYAFCNSLLDSDISDAVNNSVKLASAAPLDDANTLPIPHKVARLQTFDPRAEDFEMNDALGLTIKLLDSARGDSRVSVDTGEFRAVVKKRAIMNSKGIREEELSNYFVYYIMGMARDKGLVSSFDFEFDATRCLKDIDVEKIGRSLADKVLSSLGAERGKSFKGSVLLSPNAVHTLLLQPLIFALNANHVQRGTSRLAGRLGKEIASSQLNLIDDGTLDGGIGTEAFDREGVPHERINLIEKGRLKSFMYNTYAANRERRETTGHAQGSPRSAPNIGPTNILITPGEASKDNLAGDIKQGVLVTRFSGFPNLVTGDFSGVVKGGFLIQKGKVEKPLIATLITGNIYYGLNNIIGISKETKKLGNFVLPYIGIDNVSITST